MLDAAEVAPEPRQPVSPPRVFLIDPPMDGARLCGGWWPRSWDPLAELPGLILVLAARYGPIRAMNLNRQSWGPPFQRLILDLGVVDITWPVDIPSAQLTAQRDSGRGVQPLNLLVVPPETPDAAAKQVMRAAVDPATDGSAAELLATAADYRRHGTSSPVLD